MPGIQKPYVYIAMRGTSFGFHLEDGDLYAVNYLHYGAPKVWIFVPNEEGKKLEHLVQELVSSSPIECDFYLRHKTLLIKPSMLVKHNISYAKVSVIHPDLSKTFVFSSDSSTYFVVLFDR